MALLFCPDEKTARVVTQVLSDLEFRVEPCNEPFAAVKKLMAEHRANAGARVPHHALAASMTEWVRPGTSRALADTIKSAISGTDDADLGETIEQLIASTPERVFQWDRSHPPKPEEAPPEIR